MSEDINTKAGYVAIVGMPNSGKSTLLNSILGIKLSIVTHKPQTTRKNILGIYSDELNQIIFLDTPGLLEPRYEMQKLMQNYINDAFETADIITIIWDVERDKDIDLIDSEKFSFLKQLKQPKVLLLNKIDTLSNIKEIIPVIDKFSKLNIFNEIIPISAIRNSNVVEYVETLKNYLPKSEFYFDPEELSTQNNRFFVSEIIRESIFKEYKKEIPYSTEVHILEFKERDFGKWFISAEIIVERNSQKGIIIGKGGEALKKIAQKSRKNIESFLQEEIYLELFVKVRPGWRDSAGFLKSFGY